MSDIPKYNIRTVEDFFQVPLDRVEACLEDFKRYLMQRQQLIDGMQRTIEAAAEALRQEEGLEIPPDEIVLELDPIFIWEDDGTHTAKVWIGGGWISG